MRWLYSLLVFFSVLLVVVLTTPAAPTADDPTFTPAWGEETVLGLPPRAVPWKGLDEHASWAAAFLALAVPHQDWPYIRFFSWNGVPEKYYDDDRRVFSWWMNQLSFKQGYAVPYDVPGTKGRLQYVDIRSYGWNFASFQSVAEREPFCREEQGIGTGGTQFLQELKGAQPEAVLLAKSVPTVAEFLRQAVGVPVSDAVVGKDKFPLEALVWAPWFFRETIESDRSPSYYDLLFSKDRFLVTGKGGTEVVKKTRKIEKIWPGGVDAVGKFYPVGTKYHVDEEYEETVVSKGAFKFVDFPKNEKDWEKAFGIDVAKQFAKDQKIDIDYGAVVEGGQDIPNRGSVVSLHNRLLVTIPTPSGGVAMKTFDVAETTGERDFVEQAPKLPFGEITFDAGELLAYLPNGGLAALLTNAKGDRLETADNRFAKDGSDTKMDARVRNPGSCVICHAPAGGYILPRNLIEEMLKTGIDLKVKDKEKRDRIEAFYLGWEGKIKAYTTPYEELIVKTTRNKLDPASKGWTGAQLSAKFLQFRNWYDDPVTVEQAAVEMGLEVGAFKVLCLKSPKARLNQLVRGMPIPRRTWDVDTFREAGLFLSAQQK